MAELVFYKRGEELMHVALDRPRTTLGRGEQSDVSIPDPSVSRVQAVVERRGSRYFVVEGAGAAALGAEAVAPAGSVLEEGSEIRLGDWKAVFRTSPPPEQTTDLGKVRLDETRRQPKQPPPEVAAGPVQVRVISAGGERTVPFDSEELTIGKDEENHLMVDDPFVSSFHARLVHSAKGFWLRDLASTNGTFVDGNRFGEGEVALGARIRIGGTELVLETQALTSTPFRGFEGIVTRHPLMIQIFELIDRVAPTTVQVMVLGETGTGKELVARAIHARSPRRDRPFIAVNCAAISRELLESELFGHEKGAFTGAVKDRTGAFQEASGGTLFLDEVGEMPLDMQPKLLRALEQGEIKRVGSNKPTQVDVRIVAATNRDLLADVRKGRFREDLYYRLNVFPLNLPPLRARAGDIPYLADHFMKSNASLGRGVGLTSEALKKLEHHRFPGNVRELRNVVFRSILLGSPRKPVEPAQIQFDEGPAKAAADGHLDDDDNLYLPGRTAEECLQEVVERAVRRHEGNRSEASRELKMSRSTLIKRLEGTEEA